MSALHIEQIDGLVRAAGREGAREILNAFWRTADALARDLARHLEAGEFAEAAAAAHAVKGSAANIGASAVSDVAARLEAACRADRAAEARRSSGQAALRDLVAEVDAARASFDRHLAQCA